MCRPLSPTAAFVEDEPAVDEATNAAAVEVETIAFFNRSRRVIIVSSGNFRTEIGLAHIVYPNTELDGILGINLLLIHALIRKPALTFRVHGVYCCWHTIPDWLFCKKSSIVSGTILSERWISIDAGN